ncbi:hypothetical protein [Acetobacter syzygii]|nr:hypothetical protein [Acetobacter syzygii]
MKLMVWWFGMSAVEKNQPFMLFLSATLADVGRVVRQPGAAASA